MKRGISLLLCLVVLALTGCGTAASSDEPEPNSTRKETQTAQSESEYTTGSKTEEAGTVSFDQEPEKEPDMENKTLVAYFSATGTTEILAQYAAEILDADLYEIVPEEPYTEADLAYYTDGRADQEQNDPSARPAISDSVDNMQEYERVVIGYPIWHGQAPRIITTFLESYDFSGKTIFPFCTSHSSRIGSSAENLQGLCSEQTNWTKGRRFEAGTSLETVKEWLESVQ